VSDFKKRKEAVEARLVELNQAKQIVLSEILRLEGEIRLLAELIQEKQDETSNDDTVKEEEGER